MASSTPRGMESRRVTKECQGHMHTIWEGIWEGMGGHMGGHMGAHGHTSVRDETSVRGMWEYRGCRHGAGWELEKCQLSDGYLGERVGGGI